MAYITSHNSYKIVTRNNFKNVNLSGEIYKKKIFIFSRYEEQCLLAIQELMKDPEKYFKQIYDPIVARDTKRYVYKEQQPAYHTNKNCEMLTANFTNFELPEEIRARGDKEIERFRNWFMKNAHYMDRPEVFVALLEMAFGISYNPRAINYENSGFTEFNKNYTIKELEDKIDGLLREAGRFYYANQKNTTILSAFGKITGVAFSDRVFDNNTGYSDEDVRNFLKDYYNRFKAPLKKLLIEYYRVKLNPDLEFAENLLEALGFKKCGACQRANLNGSIAQEYWIKTGDRIEVNSHEDLPF